MATKPSTGTRPLWLTILVWVVLVLLALFIASAGVQKLIGTAPEVELFDTIGWGQWFRYFTGVCEVAGAVGLLIPRLSGLAAAGLVGVMIGATLTNLLVPGMAAASIMTVALAVVFGVIAYVRRDRTRALIASVRA